METKPYTLIIDGKLQGFYKTLQSAKYTVDQITPSKDKPSIKIYREEKEGQTLVHEE